MEFLKVMYLIWLDGWTFNHWFSTIWSITTTAMPVLIGISAYLNWRDLREYRVTRK